MPIRAQASLWSGFFKWIYSLDEDGINYISGYLSKGHPVGNVIYGARHYCQNKYSISKQFTKCSLKENHVASKWSGLLNLLYFSVSTGHMYTAYCTYTTCVWATIIHTNCSNMTWNTSWVLLQTSPPSDKIEVRTDFRKMKNGLCKVAFQMKQMNQIAKMEAILSQTKLHQ